MKFIVQKNITVNLEVEADNWEEADDAAFEILFKSHDRDDIHDYYLITDASGKQWSSTEETA